MEKYYKEDIEKLDRARVLWQKLKLKRCKKPKISESGRKIIGFNLNGYTFYFRKHKSNCYFHCVDNEKWYILENEVRK